MLRRKDGSYKTIKTYGTLGERGNPDYRVLNMPDSLRNAFNFLWKYDNPKATNWQSDFAEFVFWKYEGDSNKNVTWPKIEDIYKVSFKDGDEEFYSIFISESMEKPYSLLRQDGKGPLLKWTERDGIFRMAGSIPGKESGWAVTTARSFVTDDNRPRVTHARSPSRFCLPLAFPIRPYYRAGFLHRAGLI
ncbi:MAG: hypothetical protein IPG67_07170 [Acidobacteria bacterium]|nr:hypothetical protein [Acidobacteriota bacterium]